MTAREQLVEQAANAIYDNPELTTDIRSCREDARRVLDAILPQVSTLAELEALPDGAVVTDARGEAWKNYTGTAGTWYGTDLDELRPGVLLQHRPLTVVWQPEVTG